MSAIGKLYRTLMTARVLIFLMSWVSSVLLLALVIAAIWPLWGVGPDRPLFWILVAPLVALLLLYEIFNAVQRLRGVDVAGRKRAIAMATEAEIRRRYAGGDSS